MTTNDDHQAQEPTAPDQQKPSSPRSPARPRARRLVPAQCHPLPWTGPQVSLLLPHSARVTRRGQACRNAAGWNGYCHQHGGSGRVRAPRLRRPISRPQRRGWLWRLWRFIVDKVRTASWWPGNTCAYSVTERSTLARTGSRGRKRGTAHCHAVPFDRRREAILSPPEKSSSGTELLRERPGNCGSR